MNNRYFEFRGYAHNKCNLQAKNTLVPIYAFISTNYDNHLFINKLSKKIRFKVLTKTVENYNCFDIGYAKALDVYRIFHPLSLDAIDKKINENKKKGFKPNEKLMLKLTDKNDYVIDGEMLD